MMWRYGLILLIVLLVALAVAYLTASRLHRMITAPVLGLVETANAVSSRRDYSVRAAAGGQDESACSSSPSTTCSGQIQERDAALQRARHDLEGRSPTGRAACRANHGAEGPGGAAPAKNERARGAEPAHPGGQPAQERVPRQHVARAAHAAQRDHRLRRADARRQGRAGVRRAQGVPRRHPDQRAPPAAAHQRRARPGQGRVRARWSSGPSRSTWRRLVGEVRDILRSAGRREAHPGRRSRSTPALGRGRARPRQAQAGPLQLPVQRAQVHARRAAASRSASRPEGASASGSRSRTPASASAPEDLGRLFVEFQQLDASAAKTLPGHRPRAGADQAHRRGPGRQVGVASVHGQGSTFFAVLPRVARATPSRRAGAPAGARAPGAPTVLVIEDDTRERAWLVETLSAAGYAVEVGDHRRGGDRALRGARLRRDHARPAAARHERVGGPEGDPRGGPNQDDAGRSSSPSSPRRAWAPASRSTTSWPSRCGRRTCWRRCARAGLRPTAGRPVLVVDDDPRRAGSWRRCSTASAIATHRRRGRRKRRCAGRARGRRPP